MGNVYGKNIQLSIFGESHGAGVGMTLAGLPAGMTVDWDAVDADMRRRAPGRSPLATKRREPDAYEVLSGIFEGKTTGAPVSIVIRNTDTRSGDYDPNILRPGHADFVAFHKYGGCADHRGGGHFSGRLTAPLVAAGALCKQALRPIEISARIVSIGGITKPSEREAAILAAAENHDSLGGVVECIAEGMPVGLGEPFFNSLESEISSMMFSIPAVKGIEFGDGFAMARFRGSEANDGMSMDGENIRFASNHSGGINGGISNGQPIIFRAAVRPTPTIGREQTTVNIKTRETVTASFKGRHDPCIVPRIVPVIEAGTAVCLLDFLVKEL